MAKSFKTLRERMTPEAQARAREKTAHMMKDMALHELRSARDLTQRRPGRAAKPRTTSGLQAGAAY